GTAGARFVVAKQLRSSGGLWLSLQGVNLYMDPGAGALVRCLASKPKLDPTKLEGAGQPVKILVGEEFVKYYWESYKVAKKWVEHVRGK
ncbi:MAG: hypothetical protein HY882_00020, partial [Deltaproteobacteria bacterium]|nr:hypothetical protein [Deltaproteobacteria bacterium]